MIERRILAAPNIGMVFGTYGYADVDRIDRIYNGNAFPGERLVRVPRRFARTYHQQWLLSRGRLTEVVRPLPIAVQQLRGA